MRLLRTLSYVFASLWIVSVSCAYAGEGLTKISDNVYAYENIKSGSQNNRFGANAGIVIGDKGLLVVDTLTSAKEAKVFLQDIRKITDKPIRYVVNTHYHLDHAFGNCVFADNGAVIISHANCRNQVQQVKGQALESAKSFGMDDASLEGTRVIVPDMAFDRTLELDLGNRVVRLIHDGRTSHTGGSILVLVPDQKIVFAGDILFTNFHPYIAEGDLQGWARALDNILTLDAAKIIPGHGPLSGAKDVKDMKAYLTAFDRHAKKLCAGATDIEKVTAEMVKVLPQRADGQFIVKANLQMRYMAQEKPKPQRCINSSDFTSI